MPSAWGHQRQPGSAPRALATGMPSTHLPPGPRAPYDVGTRQYETPVLFSSRVILEKRSSPCSPLAGSVALSLKSLRRTALLARKPSGAGARSFQRGLEPRPDGHGPGKGARWNRSATGFPGSGCGEQGQGNDRAHVGTEAQGPQGFPLERRGQPWKLQVANRHLHFKKINRPCCFRVVEKLSGKWRVPYIPQPPHILSSSPYC